MDIEDDHDNIVETGFNGTVLHSGRKAVGDSAEVATKSTLDYKLSVKEIYDFARTVSYNDIEFILESRTLNLALANEGLSGNYGLRVGYCINQKCTQEVFGGEHKICVHSMN